ncbi:MAG: oxidoreductase [Synechococcales cyanobacterium]
MTTWATQLQDRVIVITGASAGIGEALAMRVAVPGAKLVLAARREGVLHTIKEVLADRGAEVVLVPTDMGDPASVQQLAETVITHFGRVDILVNNAGYGQMGPVELVSDGAVRQQFEVNFFGLLSLTRALIPTMRAQGRGRIINVSSVAGHVSMPFSGIYNATKHALEAVSDSLRIELAPFGIQVVLVEPGPVQTEFFEVAGQKTSQDIPSDNPYAAVLSQRAEITGAMAKSGWTPAQVADIMVRAMTDTHPQPRYTAFTGGKLALALMQVTPAPILDRMWAKMFRWSPPSS